jgi:regulator-associated protein of mTOR
VDPFAEVAKSAAIIVDQINMMLLDTPSVGDYVASVVRNSLLNQSNADATLAGGSLDNNGAPSSYYTNDSSTAGPPHSATASSSATRPAKLTRSVSFASTLRTIYNFGNVSPMNPTEQQSSAIPDRITSATPRPSPLSNSNNNSTPADPLVPPNNTSDTILPLSSEFYDWSCEYFTEPQMRVSKKVIVRKMMETDPLYS